MPLPSPQAQQVQPPTRRKQVKRACSNCRESHSCCGEARPCPRCVELGIESTCVDASGKKRGKKRKSPFETYSFTVSDIATDKHYPESQSTTTTTTTTSTTTIPLLAIPRTEIPHHVHPQMTPPPTMAIASTSASKMRALQQPQVPSASHVTFRQQQPMVIPTTTYQQQFLTTTNQTLPPQHQQQTFHRGNHNTTTTTTTTVMTTTTTKTTTTNTDSITMEKLDPDAIALRELKQHNGTLKNNFDIISSYNVDLLSSAILSPQQRQSQLGILITVEGGKISGWNTYFKQVLGYCDDDLLHSVQSLKDVVDASDVIRLLSCMLDSIKAQKTNFNCNFSCLKKVSRERVFARSNHTIYYDNRTRRPAFTVSVLSFDDDR